MNFKAYRRDAFLGARGADMLYATSADGEGYAAYKLPGQRVRLRAALPLAKGLLGSMRFRGADPLFADHGEGRFGTAQTPRQGEEAVWSLSDAI